jgi:hypothetical protein
VLVVGVAASLATARADEARASLPDRPRATVQLIGEAGGSPDLAALLRELLGRRQIAADVTSQPRFAPDQLTGPGAPHALMAFVVMEDHEHVRLYFRAPSGERFLVRELSLPSGLDALGRETIGQVVESSIEILLRSATTGIDRTQIRSELARQQRESTGTSPSVTDALPFGLCGAGAHRWRLWVGLHYAGA